MDIHIFYEHVEREIYNAFLIKFELEKRGYDVLISRTQEPILPSLNAPKVILMPWLYGNHNVDDLKIMYLKPFYKILNLQYEQVMSQMWLDAGYYVSSGKARNANQLCWGEKRKQILIDGGIDEKNLVIIGDIRQDFSKPEFKDFFKTKKQLSEEFNIPLDNSWNFFISSFSFTTPTEEVKEYVGEMMGRENSEKWQDISVKSQENILKWIEKFVSENPNQEFIYRPHPSEVKDTDYSQLYKLNEKYGNFHFIFKYSVQDWILNCDFINTWISTSIIECYSLNKVCNILRPVKVDEYFDIPFYINAEHVTDYEVFKQRNLHKNNLSFPIKHEEIKKYYDTIGEEGFIYKKICDYIEEMINNDSFKKDFYQYNSLIDNSIYVFKKIISNRIFAIFKNVLQNKKHNELKHVEEIDKDKIIILKKIVDDNF